jgi:coatomer subunit epsilon
MVEGSGTTTAVGTAAAAAALGPDELYTLRAQFALGHYSAALTEANQVARRPMSAALKQEREEYVRRAQMALHQYDLCAASAAAAAPGEGPGTNFFAHLLERLALDSRFHLIAQFIYLLSLSRNNITGLQALALQAQYQRAIHDASLREQLVDRLKSLAATGEPGPTARLAAAHVCLDAGDTAAAYQFLDSGPTSSSSSPELVAAKIQILLRIDRIDLASKELVQLQRTAEESVWTELAQIYLYLATGASAAADAEHAINSLAEQYGPSIYLTNLLAAALALQGDYGAAETKLQECLRDLADEQPTQHETLVNLVAILTQQGKTAEAEAVVAQILATTTPSTCSQQFAASLERVTTAFDREATKYKV